MWTGSRINCYYPEILDFSKSDTLYVYYANDDPNYFKGITFNETAGELTCEKLTNKLNRCTVPKSHFTESGYYYTKHTNHLNSKSTNYEVAPVQVILEGSDETDPDDSGDNSMTYIYSIPIYYSLLLILIMV